MAVRSGAGAGQSRLHRTAARTYSIHSLAHCVKTCCDLSFRYKTSVMAASTSRKRKVTDEHRSFQDKWTHLYLFVCVGEKPICLVCNESISVVKEYNIKRHYESKHSSKFAHLQGQIRIDKVEALKKQLQRQQYSFHKQNDDSEASVKVSYIISEKIARKSKPFTDGDFIKECMEAAVEVLCPSQKQLFSKISLSGVTVARRVEELAGDIERSLKERVSQFVYYSVALDESTDLTDTAQLAMFIRGVDVNFVVTEEMAALVPMKGTTRGCDLMESFNTVINRFNLKLSNLAGICTDGAPSMVGKNEGLVALIKKNNPDISFIQYHCIIHQENLSAKSVSIQEVMNVVIKAVNFIKSRGLNHRQFQEFLKETNAEYGDITYFCDVRWLSRGKMLKRVFDLRKEIAAFMQSKDKAIPQFADEAWLSDLGFLADITSHLNDLNKKLQGKDNLVHELFDALKAFEVKLDLWINQFKKNVTTHFPNLSSCQTSNMDKYITALQDLKTQFASRFSDFRKNEINLNLFAHPFNVSVEDAPEEVQMELIELQCNSTLKDKFNLGLIEFYSKYIPISDFPKIRDHALKMTSLFGTSYLCEQLFSRMKNVKSKTRTRITDVHLENSLRIATTTIGADIDKLVKSKQCQTSH